jgi:hypothetical protein
MRVLILIVALSLVGACGSVTGPSRPVLTQFVLAPGESSRIVGTTLQLRFQGVFGDSRCPADAICILGGDALVRIDVRENGRTTGTYDLHTGSMETVRHDDLTIILVELLPYPFSSRPIARDDYRATLRVTSESDF